jgi:hypothetical protein
MTFYPFPSFLTCASLVFIFQIYDPIFQLSNFIFQIYDPIFQLSDFIFQIYDPIFQLSDFIFKNSDPIFQLSDLIFHNSNSIFQLRDVLFQLSGLLSDIIFEYRSYFPTFRFGFVITKIFESMVESCGLSQND